MPKNIHRRSLLAGAIAAGGYWLGSSVCAQTSRSANERLAFACVGVGGKGSSDLRDARNRGDIIAICDIDDSKLGRAGSQFPRAEKYVDFRKLLETHRNSIDGVVISTPDHTHAVIAAMAMKMGKHVFCQKPLAHSVYECRRLLDISRRQNVVTQMGIQGCANKEVRAAVEQVRRGIIGEIREIHCWTNRPVWPQGIMLPQGESVPPGVHWDEFLGPAPNTPYSPQLHPFKWRGFWRFGSGAIGDMACHMLTVAHMALDLRNPLSIESSHSGHNGQSFPNHSKVQWKFPANARRGQLVLHWYDGGQQPPKSLMAGPLPKSGCLLVGKSGQLLSEGDYNTQWVLLPENRPLNTVGNTLPSDVTSHFGEFADAIINGGCPIANFDMAAPFTETVLLGNVAIWAGKPIDWDAQAMKARGEPSLETVIQPEYRQGYIL